MPSNRHSAVMCSVSLMRADNAVKHQLFQCQQYARMQAVVFNGINYNNNPTLQWLGYKFQHNDIELRHTEPCDC